MPCRVSWLALGKGVEPESHVDRPEWLPEFVTSPTHWGGNLNLAVKSSVARSKPNTLFRVLVLVFWIGLFGMLLRRDYFVDTLSQRKAMVVREHARKSFMGVYFRANGSVM